MLQEPDAERITALQRRTGAKTKIEVVRRALTLFERRIARVERERQWARAARLVAKESHAVNAEFQAGSLLRRHDG
jgi:hypothetical protein